MIRFRQFKIFGVITGGFCFVLLLLNCNASPQDSPTKNNLNNRVEVPFATKVDVPTKVLRAKKRSINLDSMQRQEGTIFFNNTHALGNLNKNLNFTPTPLTWQAKKRELNMASGFSIDSIHMMSTPNGYISTGRPFRLVGQKRRVAFSKATPSTEATIQPKATENILTINKNQGLESNYINDLHFNKDQYMFIGTSGGGLIRFDASQFWRMGTGEGLPSNDITAIAEDSSGNLWMGTHGGGMVCWKNNVATVYTQNSGLLSNFITAVHVDQQQRLWIASEAGGLSVLENGNITHLTINENGPAEIVSKIKKGPNGLLHFIAPQEGLFVLENEQFQFYPNESLNTENIVDVVWSKSGEMTLATVQNVYKIKESRVLKLTGFRPQAKLKSLTITREKLAVSTEGNGLFLLDGTACRHYSTSNGLSNDYIQGTKIDPSGALWTYSLGGGLNQLPQQKINYYFGEQNPPFKHVTSMMETKNNTKWFGSLSGQVCRLKNGVYEDIHFGTLKPKSAIRAFLETKDGRIWIGTEAGIIYVIDRNKCTKFQLNSKKDFPVTCLYQDGEGGVWIGSIGGGLMVYGKEGAYVYSQRGGLSSNSVFAIVEDRLGRICLGMGEGGFSQLENDVFTHFALEKDGISTVLSIVKNKNGNIWLATFGSGLFCFDGATFFQVNENTGLNSNRLTGLKLNQDELFVFSEEAITQLSLSKQPKINMGVESNRGVVDRITLFNERNGLLPKGNFVNSQMLDAEGVLWLGTRETLMSFSPKGTEESSTKTAPKLECLTIMNQDGSIQECFLDNAENQIQEFFEVAAQPQSVKLSFSFPSWDKKQEVQWKYRIEGKDAHWQSLGNMPTLDFKSLASGEYIVSVSAGYKGGVWSPVKQIKFHIQPPWYLSTWAFITYTVLLIWVVHIYAFCKNKLLRKRQIKLKKKVEIATKEIQIQKQSAEQQSEKVTRQKNLIEAAHKEITDSIKYAKRIQNAILPSGKDLKTHLPNSFVLYKPKDVVAGDFYWLQPWGNQLMIAAADCTGHGVPGAMVSVFCNNGLNRSVREHAYTSPNEVLEKTREIVLEEFKKSDDLVKDGMDIALCNLSGRTLSYAGANNPLWIIRKGSTELEEIKADKQPIGFFTDPKPYKTHTFELNFGDRFYIFSDGYADQFGGEKGKKFKSANFKKLLLSIQKESMNAQKEILDEVFETWRGDLEQVDDVCVIGVEIQ